MSRERELLKRMRDQHIRYGGYLAREHFEAISAILSPPEGAEMSRERELLRECLAFIKNWRETGSPIGYNDMAGDISAVLSPPEAEPSKTVYGVLATAYRPSQHEASIAAVERHKEPSISETDAAAFDHLVIHSMHDGMELRKYVKSDGVHEILSVCAKLERQRDELRAENEELRSKLNKGETNEQT